MAEVIVVNKTTTPYWGGAVPENWKSYGRAMN